jgi:intracellular sulfur oxidation DsrE/DsrF family protein
MSTKFENASMEMINAYIDGELMGADKKSFEKQLETDSDLLRKVEEIRHTKMAVKAAYQSVKAPVSRINKAKNYRAVAMSLMLFVMFSAGWIASNLSYNLLHPEYSNTQVGQASINVNGQGKYILHIDVKDEEKFKRVLAKTQELLNRYASYENGVQLEVIANAGGVDLFRRDVSSHTESIEALSAEYSNVKFIACTNAIERLEEKGIEPNLISTVHQDTTALDLVVKRMNQGWSYIKI